MDTRIEGCVLELTEEERALLAVVLRSDLMDLRGEVYKTENYDWRQALKSRESLLRGILDRLAALAA